MPPTSSGSFIPKRTTGTKPKSVRRYNFFILSIVSYILFVSAPLASFALFIYQIRVETQYKAAVTNLEEQIKGFKDADLTRVIEFDERLEQSKKLVKSHVSLGALLAILENATAETVQFKNLNIKRQNDTTFTVTAGLTTSALDGVLFQRSTYNANTQIEKAKLSGVSLALAAPVKSTEKTPAPAAAEKDSVTLNAEFTFSADKILYVPVGSVPGTSAGVETIQKPVSTATTSKQTSL